MYQCFKDIVKPYWLHLPVLTNHISLIYDNNVEFVRMQWKFSLWYISPQTTTTTFTIIEKYIILLQTTRNPKYAYMNHIWSLLVNDHAHVDAHYSVNNKSGLVSATCPLPPHQHHLYKFKVDFLIWLMIYFPHYYS